MSEIYNRSRLRLITLVVLLLIGTNEVLALDCVNENEAIVATTPNDRFSSNGDGTVTHLETGLVWMRCSLGQVWTGSDCSGSADAYTWQAALQESEQIAFAGHTDWRLPNKNELSSIVEERCWRPSINAEIFPSTPSGSSSGKFWTSSPDISERTSLEHDSAFNVSFVFGNLSTVIKSAERSVRLVR